MKNCFNKVDYLRKMGLIIMPPSPPIPVFVHNWENSVLSRAKKTGRQNQALAQWKMLHCKTVVNIITYHVV
jgi:hypothetical protein